jgi:hypothetical protein
MLRVVAVKERQMLWLGMLLMLIGFVLVVPRGALAGSAAVRNVTTTHQVSRTPGYQPAPTGRARVARLVVGGVCLIGGFVVILVAG